LALNLVVVVALSKLPLGQAQPPKGFA